MNPGNELDALVAERVMGCDLEPNEPCGTSLSHCPYDKSEHTRFFLTGLASSGTPKPYSTDISAAWEVVEKLGSNCSISYRPRGKHIAAFDIQITALCPLGVATGFGRTVPYAICLAALKAVGYEMKGAA